MTEISQFQTRLAEAGYVAENDLAATLLLQAKLERPLLLEGDADIKKLDTIAAQLQGLVRLVSVEACESEGKFSRLVTLTDWQVFDQIGRASCRERGSGLVGGGE